MSKNLDSSGLKLIADQYDLFFIDLWGVIHNGIDLYKNSVEVLQKLFDKKKEIVLLTNAPRPNNNVIDFFRDKNIIGEITIVVKGIRKTDFNPNKSIIKKDLNDLINAGLSLSAASKYLAKKNGLKKSEVYNLI